MLESAKKKTNLDERKKDNSLFAKTEMSKEGQLLNTFHFKNTNVNFFKGNNRNI